MFGGALIFKNIKTEGRYNTITLNVVQETEERISYSSSSHNDLVLF